VKYTININQRAAVELGLSESIDLIDLALFDAFKSFANSARIERRVDTSGIWFWISYSEIINELPLSGIKTKDGIYRRMKKLASAGLIVFHPENQRLCKTFFKWGDNYDAMERAVPTDEKPKVNPDLRMKSRRGTDEKPEVPTDEKPNNHSTTLNPNTKPCSIDLAENEFPQPGQPGSEEDQKNAPPQIAPVPPAGPSDMGTTKIRVTIIEGHEEEIEIDQPLPKKRKPPANDHFIKKMATTFEAEHKKHFKDHGGEWVGFTWQPKEFPALKNIKAELERRFNQKLHKAPTEPEILQSWELFLSKAAGCDKFILTNCFTPSKLWGQFQSIINKIYAESTTTTQSGSKPTIKDRNDAAVRRILADITSAGS